MLDQILKGGECRPGSRLITPANEPISERGDRVNGAAIFSANQSRAAAPKEIPSFLQHAAGFAFVQRENGKGDLNEAQQQNRPFPSLIRM